MKSLKLADWANIAEIVAAVVIVISLAYVGLEINQNTKALQNESHRSTLEMMNSGQNILATDEEFHRIYISGLESPADLNEAEWSRFVQFMLPRIGAVTNSCLAARLNDCSWPYGAVGFRQDRPAAMPLEAASRLNCGMISADNPKQTPGNCAYRRSVTAKNFVSLRSRDHWALGRWLPISAITLTFSSCNRCSHLVRLAVTSQL